MRDDQQANINQLQSQINEMAVVGLSQESELNKKDERAHNLYYENANLQMLIEEKNKRIEELKVQLSLQRDRNKALEVELTNSRNYGDSLHSLLTNMERCYIEIKQEHNELIAFNTGIDRKQKVAEKTAEKYKFKVSMIADLLRDCVDQDMTLKAIKTVIDRVGES